MWNELGRRESGILGIDRGAGDSKFFGRFVNRNIDQHNYFMGRKDPKVGPYKKSLYEEDKTGIQGTCHSFMAIDPECFVGREKFKKEMDRYIQTIKESMKAKNAAEILMPGEPEYRTEASRLKEGIPLAPNTVKELIALGESFGISLPIMNSHG